MATIYFMRLVRKKNNSNLLLFLKKKMTTVNKKNLHTIDLSIYKTIKFNLDDLNQKDFNYFNENVKDNVEKLILCGNIIKFFKTLDKQYSNLITLIIDNLTTSKYFWNYNNKIEFPKKSWFPKLIKLIIPSFNIPITFDYKINYIRITVSYNENGYCVPENTITILPKNLLQNLKGALFDVQISEKVIKQLCCNSTQLKRLALQIYLDKDIENFNNIFLKDSNTTLKEIKLCIKNVGFKQNLFSKLYLKKFSKFENLNLIIIEFHLRSINDDYLNGLNLKENLKFLNEIDFEKVVIEFKCHSPCDGNLNEINIAKHFCDLYKTIEINFKYKLLLKYGNKKIEIVKKKKS
jgi:hypothetical protein